MKKHLSEKEAYIRSAELCSRSERCFFDIREKLKQWNVPEEHHEKILEKLEQEGFIDEKRYTEAFVYDKFSFNKWGRQKIRFHLRSKGVDNSIIAEALKEKIENEVYQQTLNEIIEIKLRTLKYKDEYDKKQKLVRFATSRGFEPHLVFDILD